MPRVNNWQIGRTMSYWYGESRPKRQFGAIFDINKCIACQTCTLACKTTWTSGRGQEYMLWNNVETKPYGGYPLSWDVQLLDRLGPPARFPAGKRRLRVPECGRGRNFRGGG
jgi:nitrate reductase beta subunit